MLDVRKSRTMSSRPACLTTILLVVFSVLLPVGSSLADSDKVRICHRPPGNPDNYNTITIDQNAVAAHLGKLCIGLNGNAV